MRELFGLTLPLLYIHISTIVLVVILILIADSYAISWMRGKKETLDKKLLLKFHTLMWTGLLTMIASGLLMFLPLKGYLLYTPVFYIKMGFVLMLTINAFYIGKFLFVAAEKSFASLNKKEKKPLMISGALSFIGWLGAIVAALNLGV